MAFLTGGYNSSSTSSTSQYNKTGTTNRNLTPFQTNLQAPVFSQIMKQLSDPYAAVAPFRQQARNQVNQNYSGLADQLRQQFFTTGGGGSGKYGQATLQGELARRGQLSDVDQQAQMSAAQNQLSWQQIAQQLLGMNFGTTSTESGTAAGTGERSGFNIGGGVGV